MSARDTVARERLDEIVATVSHELRTPLTAIVGALGLLRGRAAGDLPREAARLVQISDDNARRLLRLVDDLLYHDRRGAGSLQVHRRPIDLRDVVRCACDGGEGLAAARRVRLACQVPPAPLMVEGDADRLVQVVTNLLSNAVRVTPIAFFSFVHIRWEAPFRAYF